VNVTVVVRVRSKLAEAERVSVSESVPDSIREPVGVHVPRDGVAVTVLHDTLSVSLLPEAVGREPVRETEMENVLENVSEFVGDG